MSPSNSALHQKPVLVLLGASNQSFDFLKDHSHGEDNHEYCFCTNMSDPKWRSGEFSDVVTYGTFWERDDAREFYDASRTRVR